MAVRSGAGTGVIVSLIVSVIISVALLVTTIIFYSEMTKAKQSQSESDGALSVYVKPQEKTSDRFKLIEQNSGRESVASFLASRNDEMSRWVGGGEPKSIDQLKADLEGLGVDPGTSVRDAMSSMNRKIRDLRDDVESYQRNIADRDDELRDKEQQIADLRGQHERQLEGVENEISGYRAAADEYRADLQSTIARMDSRVVGLEEQYRDEIRELEDDLDTANENLVIARQRLNDYENILSEIRMRGQDPALLVDAEVLEVDSGSRDVYINRGRRDRMVLGMTFEVYDSSSAIRLDGEGELPRGKASLKVTRVGETSSTARVTRAVSGRPVVRGDVLANAIYDPNRRFKFLIHGKFDLDSDGRATEAEAERLRSLVLDWGGEVVLGSTLPGDLDFLVLGEQPPTPAPLPLDPPKQLLELTALQIEAKQTYERLFEQARDAEIPVLNSNRFFILIGQSGS